MLSVTILTFIYIYIQIKAMNKKDMTLTSGKNRLSMNMRINHIRSLWTNLLKYL